MVLAVVLVIVIYTVFRIYLSQHASRKKVHVGILILLRVLLEILSMLDTPYVCLHVYVQDLSTGSHLALYIQALSRPFSC